MRKVDEEGGVEVKSDLQPLCDVLVFAGLENTHQTARILAMSVRRYWLI